MKTKITLVVFFIAHYFISSAQPIPFKTFNFDEGLDGWTATIIEGEGFWDHAKNGKAELGMFWNDRDSIHSDSGGGAMVCDGDWFSSNASDPNFSIITAIESPDISIPEESRIIIKFNQYFRNLNSKTKLEVQKVDENGSFIWVEYPINLDVRQNVETSPADIKYIDITPEEPEVIIKVRFVFEGDYYFWIIDDVEFYTEDPSPQTFPTRYGDSLEVFGKPFAVDSSNWPYVPNEVIVQFSLEATAEYRDSIRDSLGVSLKKACDCDRLELWTIGEPGGDNPSPNGNSIGINEIVAGASQDSEIDGVDLNRYNFNELQNLAPTPNGKIESIPEGIIPYDGPVTLVAILDTGIDYEHDSLRNYIYWNNDDQLNNKEDDDDNCLVDDPLGWNFVDDNNNIKDDHSHGTHVAGIITRNFEKLYGENCEMRIIGYKTHDSYGTSNLFDVTCATYQAILDNVNVINDSWGFYGDSSIILSNAIDEARNNDILIITAAGNDSLDLAMDPQYPACYDAPNVLTVGSYEVIDTTTSASMFSNYDPTCVDILAPGRDIISWIPDNKEDVKTGTSMAAPAVSAAAAIAYCSGGKNFDRVRDNILNCADKYGTLENNVLNGNVLNYSISCLTPVEDIVKEDLNNFLVYPNPVVNQIHINSSQELGEAQIQVFDLTGQVMFSKKINHWNESAVERIEAQDWSSGIYLLKIYSEHFHWSYKVIKI